MPIILDFIFKVFEPLFSKLNIKLSPDMLDVIIPNLLRDKLLLSVLKYASERKVSV